MHRHVKNTVAAALVLAGTALSQAQTPVDSGWTYQGRLTDNGAAPSGSFDFRFTLCSNAAGTTPVGSPVTLSAVPVTGGLFTVKLDFGAQFTGSKRWLRTEVKPAGGPTYTALAPVQEVTGVPQSLFSMRPWETAGAGVQYGGSVGIGGPADANYGLAVSHQFYGISHIDGARQMSTFINSQGCWLGTVSADPLHFFTGDSAPQMTLSTTGTLGINVTPGSGYRLHVNAPDSQIPIFATVNNNRGIAGWVSGPNGWGVSGDNTTANTLGILGTNGEGVYGFTSRVDRFGGKFSNSAAGGIALEVPTGLTRVKTLQILGGADLAEPFNVNAAAGASDEAAPGMVVVIDADHPGELRLASAAYDTRVAGIISGANGLEPGMVMKAVGTEGADGKHPVAMTGRVWCWVDASGGAVTPGDMLTTSSTPGHAMVASDRARAHGAVIGKAMTGLPEGRGLVLVLVNLQ